MKGGINLMQNNYLIIIEQSECGFSAYAPDVPGVAATGLTPEIARKEFLKALEFHFEGMAEDNEPIPQPSALFSYSTEDASGVLNVRTAKTLHSYLIRLAQEEKVSVSHLVNDAIVAKYMGGRTREKVTH
jgi:predicted RNase H-like HicB family nuclease